MNYRVITATYKEDKWTETCELTETIIRVTGLPLVFANATNVEELLQEEANDKYGSITRQLERIRTLLVPKGQEVTLRSFHNQEGHQTLIFHTICDHGD